MDACKLEKMSVICQIYRHSKTVAKHPKILAKLPKCTVCCVLCAVCVSKRVCTNGEYRLYILSHILCYLCLCPFGLVSGVICAHLPSILYTYKYETALFARYFHSIHRHRLRHHQHQHHRCHRHSLV